jgi:hypothetical protein
MSSPVASNIPRAGERRIIPPMPVVLAPWPGKTTLFTHFAAPRRFLGLSHHFKDDPPAVCSGTQAPHRRHIAAVFHVPVHRAPSAPARRPPAPRFERSCRILGKNAREKGVFYGAQDGEPFAVVMVSMSRAFKIGPCSAMDAAFPGD